MQDKITYIARFEPFNWMVGTGDYVFKIQNDLQYEIIEHLQHIPFGEDGYLSVMDGKQFSLLESADDRDRFAAVAYHIDAEGVFRSDWYQSDGIPVSDQLIYAEPMPMWNWVLLAGAYSDSGIALLQQQRQAISLKERGDKAAYRCALFNNTQRLPGDALFYSWLSACIEQL